MGDDKPKAKLPTYDAAKEFEILKAKEARKIIEQVQANADSVNKIINVQLTKVLMDLSELEKQLEHLVMEYWMKELPIQGVLVRYMSNVSSLINIYTQAEQQQKKTVEEIYATVEFPDFQKFEEKYKELFDELNNRMGVMKEEVDNFKKDIEDEYEDKLKKESKLERDRIDALYKDVLDKSEQAIIQLLRIVDEIVDDSSPLEKPLILSKIDEIKKILSLKIPTKTIEKEIIHDWKDDEYIPPKKVVSSGVEIIKPPIVKEKTHKTLDYKDINLNYKKDLAAKIIYDLHLKGMDYTSLRKVVVDKLALSHFYEGVNVLRERKILDYDKSTKEFVWMEDE